MGNRYCKNVFIRNYILLTTLPKMNIAKACVKHFQCLFFHVQTLLRLNTYVACTTFSYEFLCNIWTSLFSIKQFLHFVLYDLLIIYQGRQLAPWLTWQFWERRSHKRIVLSRDPDRKVSLIGDILKHTTLQDKQTLTT